MLNHTDFTTAMLGTMQSGGTRRVKMWAQLAKQRPTVTEQAANANATEEMEQMPNNSDPASKGQIRST